MIKIFAVVCNRSLTAAYCAVAVLCIRLCMRRLPKSYSYFLWTVVFVRFAVPFSLGSVYNLAEISGRAVSAVTGFRRITQLKNGLGSLAISADRIEAMPFLQAENAAKANPLPLLTAASWIWLAVAAALLCYGAVSYCLLKQRLKNAGKIQERVYVAEWIPTAFVMGVFRPRIYIPEGLTEQERAYIVSHEQVHIKRKDYLIKQIAFWLACVHWFNPMAWVSFRFMCDDMELSCDEQVLRLFGSDAAQNLLHKKQYAATLLKMAGSRQVRLSGPLLFGGSVKGRIANILRFKQPAGFVTVLSVTAVVVAAAGLMGSGRPGTLPDVDVNSFLVQKGYSYVCRIPEAYWAGIEGRLAGEKTYPIILATDQVYDNRDGNMTTFGADVYCLMEEGLQKVGAVTGGGTAYPLCYDKTGIYANAGNVGNRCVINTDTWQIEIAEQVGAVYDSEEERYYRTEGGVTSDADVEVFSVFFERESVVMNFAELAE